jgi:ubiquinone biosynthesis accessory factor UbiJ
MFQTMQSLFGAATMERLTLFLNHVLSAEPVAVQRLQAHAGRSVRLELRGWPGLLPALPPTTFRVSAAGLLEWSEGDTAEPPHLLVSIDASNPALAAVQALGGARPRVDVSGDAAFATDLNWLFDNLRWDVQDDLARVLGPLPAREIARLGGGVKAGLREAARTLGELVQRRGDVAAGQPRS